MDNLVLIRVVAALDAYAAEPVSFRELRQEAVHRYRLILDAPERGRSVRISLDPRGPWIGSPARRDRRPVQPTGPFAASASRALGGLRLLGVEKPDRDRSVRFRFAGGSSLVVELAAHGGNLILLDGDDSVQATARRPRSSLARVGVGQPYEPAQLPARLFDPLSASADEIDARLDSLAADGVDRSVSLRRHFFGIGEPVAFLILDESRHGGRSAGQVLASRIAALRAGGLEPVVEAREEPIEAAENGCLDSDAIRLLPWDPGVEGGPTRTFLGRDAAATAGIYHEALEVARSLTQRRDDLRAMLEREIRRTGEAGIRAASDARGFADPEKHQRWGESLLAGLHRAERLGDSILVPDPYDPDQGSIAVPARPGLTVDAAAREQFRLARRARRGAEKARERQAQLAERATALRSILAAFGPSPGEGQIEETQARMRAAGIPVGLEAGTRAGRDRARGSRPRLEGVRIYRAADGSEILVGRTARDNHRLTFRLAGPEDFWLHALGSSGAHAVIRNPSRSARPTDAALEEAASLAAWFSAARNQDAVDVAWTRRKYVRRPRGAAPGAVTLKRFETVRVQPTPPPDSTEDG